MRISLIGSRGIPARYGGFETFVQHLSEILSDAGHEVTVIGEKGSIDAKINFGKIVVQESRYSKAAHPLLFYIDSLRMTSGTCDILLVCGVGGSLFYPLFRSKKTKIITNVDGLEHLRGKYSFLKKAFVRMSQRMARANSDILIADSEQVGKFWIESLASSSDKLRVISYGADPALPFRQEDLDTFGLLPSSYFLVIARLVPENHIREIIDGFLLSGSLKKLLIVGGLDQSAYVSKLFRKKDPRIIFTGAIYVKQVLDSLRKGAFAYIHGHSVGGTNPSLLEAMAASCLCICHDNFYNHEVTSSEQLYFRSSEELKLRIDESESMSGPERDRCQHAARNRAISDYSWKKIGDQYLKLLAELHEGRSRI